MQAGMTGHNDHLCNYLEFQAPLRNADNHRGSWSMATSAETPETDSSSLKI